MKKLNRWAYVVSGVLILLIAGLVYAWSVMASVINRELQASQGELSSIFTVVMIMFCIGGFVAGFFSKKVKPKVYVILAAVLLWLGFTLASKTEGVTLLYLGVGVLAGLGSGFAYNAVMSTVSAWFPDKQGLVSGILLMGFGLSSFIIGKWFVAVTPENNSSAWRSTFGMMAIAIVVILVICSFFFERPSADYTVPSNTKKKLLREPASEVSAAEMVKKSTFWLYYAWATLVSGAGLVLVSQASGIATQVANNLKPGTIATIVGLISICNGVGRVLFGALFDKKGYKVTMIVDMIVFVTCGGILILALQTGTVVILVAGFIVGGFAYGGVTPTNSAIISDFYGRSNYAMNFSIINTNLIIASFASAIAGKLYDASNSYMSTIIMIIGVTVLGFFAFLGIKRPKVHSD